MSFLYQLFSLGALAILVIWGFIDLKSGDTRNGMFLIGLGIVDLIAYGAGHLRERQQHRELSSLQARIADRTLTPKKQTLLKARLSGFPGQKIQIAVESDWDEARSFALSLRDSLVAAGWMASMGPQTNSNRGGMTIVGRHIGTSGPAYALSQTLTLCEVRHRTMEYDSEEIFVRVGVKD